MSTSIAANVHVDPSAIRHDYKAAGGRSGGYATLDFGRASDDVRIYLHFHSPAEIDAVIAELVALKQEMAPPVITRDEAAEFTEHSETHGERDGGDFEVFRKRVLAASEDDAQFMLWFIHGYCPSAAWAALERAAPVITGSEPGDGGVLFPADDADEPGPMDDEAELRRADEIREAAEVLDASIASGTPVLVTDDEPARAAS